MRRGYTAEEYREMIERIRRIVPGAAVTSDFIVGFCGETEADFLATVDLVRWARFKNSFIFKYSPRPGTKAVELYADDVPEEVKRRRNNELLAVQNAISLEDNQAFVGRAVEVLVEGPSKSARKRLGRRVRGKWSAARRATGSWCSTESGDWRAKSSRWSSRADALTLYGAREPAYGTGGQGTERQWNECNEKSKPRTAIPGARHWQAAITCNGISLRRTCVTSSPSPIPGRPLILSAAPMDIPTLRRYLDDPAAAAPWLRSWAAAT